MNIKILVLLLLSFLSQRCSVKNNKSLTTDKNNKCLDCETPNPTTERKLIPGSSNYTTEMVYVEGGTFTMGCSTNPSYYCSIDEEPTHAVSVSSFSIGKYEVTQAQWRAVMGDNPSHFSGCDRCPVEQVSWDDVQKFISKLNKITGKKYRLPTEAEWEYAARGGNRSKGYQYSGSNNVDSVAWYKKNSEGKTHPVGSKSPNELGIYDMSGNVWEWCSDWFDAKYYSISRSRNPKGASKGTHKVLRGSGWIYFEGSCGVTQRNSCSPSLSFNNFGFRLVLVP
jgi:sulfatase modifying factor 1